MKVVKEKSGREKLLAKSAYKDQICEESKKSIDFDYTHEKCFENIRRAKSPTKVKYLF